jgi:hypothetical protein
MVISGSSKHLESGNAGAESISHRDLLFATGDDRNSHMLLGTVRNTYHIAMFDEDSKVAKQRDEVLATHKDLDRRAMRYDIFIVFGQGLSNQLSRATSQQNGPGSKHYSGRVISRCHGPKIWAK